ncbi:hypothetical protein HDU78_009741 [Chytriomyces hyalinus]|nr:hypothetical protein HDU78_009741 [Chytriomyces hyalinus]
MDCVQLPHKADGIMQLLNHDIEGYEVLVLEVSGKPFSPDGSKYADDFFKLGQEMKDCFSHSIHSIQSMEKSTAAVRQKLMIIGIQYHGYHIEVSGYCRLFNWQWIIPLFVQKLQSILADPLIRALEAMVLRPFLDTVLAEYAVKTMKVDKCHLNLFLKKGTFTSSNHADEVKETLQAVMKRTLKTLDSMDLDNKTAEWFRYWDKLKSAESKQRNRQKCDSEADYLLTAAVAKVRKQEQNLLEKPKKKARLQLIELIKCICNKPPLGHILVCLGLIQACFKTEAACDNSQALVIDLRHNNKDISSSIPPETVEEYISYIAEC